MSLLFCLLAILGIGPLMAGDAIFSNDKNNDSISYGDTRDFLSQHTKLIELNNGAEARVAIAPEWQGRVMTSTCEGTAGPSFGFVNREFIAARKPDRQFNNYGAEDRMWLCPEGGPFSLWFQYGAQQVQKNWHTPPALNEGAWKVVSKPNDRSVRMTAHLAFQNTATTPFTLDVMREVRLLGIEDLQKMLGPWAAGVITQADVKSVAYETENRVVNRGAAFSKESGLISIRILGTMNAGPRSVILVPYKPGPVGELGPVVKSDYFGLLLPDRMKINNDAVLLLADGKFRSKIGISQHRARNMLGSIDFDAGVLTLVQFSMPDDPGKCDYLNNRWGLPQDHPYTGDVVNAYNDGPNDLGRQLGAFYEIESISPALIRKTGESLVHLQRTIHIKADRKTLAKLTQEVLGIELYRVEHAFP